MATPTVLRRCPIIPWRLLIGATLLIFFVSLQQNKQLQRRAGVVTAFGSTSRTTRRNLQRDIDSEINSCDTTMSRMIRSSIASTRRSTSFTTSCRRRLRSSSSSSSLYSFSNLESREAQIGSYHKEQSIPSTIFSRTQSSLFRTSSSITTTSTIINSKFRRNRFFSSNVPTLLHSTASPTTTEEDSMDTTYGKARFSEEVGEEETINNKDDLLEGLISKPVEGGNWVPGASLDWATDFGRRSPEYDKLCREDETSFYRLHPGDEGYFDVTDIDSQIQNATIVRTKEQARIVMEKLMNANPGLFHACDTEVMDIKLKEVGPVGNGYVTCLSVYSGPNFDYGLGAPIGSTLWIDNLDDAHGILQEFKPWMEDERFKKIWHNYGFDRHVMWNEGIDCRGFGGDTMHMARLQDTSRMKNGGGGYSLEALTSELLNMRKRPMKEIFGVARIKKDGSPGSLVDVPPIEVLQRDPEFRKNFIAYSCYDAVGTWELHQRLVALLKKMEWISKDTNLFDYYWENMRYFAEVLTDMERRGIRVDAKDYLASVEVQARKDRKEHLKKFRQWAAGIIGPDGLAINPASATQLATFLFGGSENLKTKEPTEDVRVFKVAREEVPEDAIKAYIEFDEKKKEQNPSKGMSSFCFL